MLKVAFIGPRRSGRSTLMEQMRGEFGEIGYFVPEASQSTPGFVHVPEGQRHWVGPQGMLQRQSMHLEGGANRSGARVAFCHRSVFDPAIYTAMYGDEVGGLELLRRALDRGPLSGYVKVYLLDPHDIPNVVVGEQRIENPSPKSHAISEYGGFVRFLSEWNIDHDILTGDVDVRAKQVTEDVNELLEAAQL